MCTSTGTSSCGCGPATGTSAEGVSVSDAGRDSYTVSGMTCNHCVMSVTEGVSGIEGVTAVDVDLATGRVAIGTDRPVTRDQVQEAVEQAGYALV